MTATRFDGPEVDASFVFVDESDQTTSTEFAGALVPIRVAFARPHTTPPPELQDALQSDFYTLFPPPIDATCFRYGWDSARWRQRSGWPLGRGRSAQLLAAMQHRLAIAASIEPAIADRLRDVYASGTLDAAVSPAAVGRVEHLGRKLGQICGVGHDRAVVRFLVPDGDLGWAQFPPWTRRLEGRDCVLARRFGRASVRVVPVATIADAERAAYGGPLAGRLDALITRAAKALSRTPRTGRAATAVAAAGSAAVVVAAVFARGGADRAPPPPGPGPVPALAGILVVASDRDTPGETDVYAMNADGTGLRRLARGTRPRLSADGRAVYFLRDGAALAGRGTVYRVPIEGGEPTLIVDDVDRDGVAPSPDGERLAFSRTDPSGCRAGAILSAALGTGEVTKVVDDGRVYRVPDWASTGTVAAIDATGCGAAGRLVLARAGSPAVAVGGVVPDAGGPRFSHDGRRIAYGVGASGPSLRVVGTDGSAPIVLYRDARAQATPVGWSPDDRHVLFTRAVHGRPAELWLVPSDGSAPAQLLRAAPAGAVVGYSAGDWGSVAPREVMRDDFTSDDGWVSSAPDRLRVDAAEGVLIADLIRGHAQHISRALPGPVTDVILTFDAAFDADNNCDVSIGLGPLDAPLAALAGVHVRIGCYGGGWPARRLYATAAVRDRRGAETAAWNGWGATDFGAGYVPIEPARTYRYELTRRADVVSLTVRDAAGRPGAAIGTVELRDDRAAGPLERIAIGRPGERPDWPTCWLRVEYLRVAAP